MNKHLGLCVLLILAVVSCAQADNGNISVDDAVQTAMAGTEAISNVISTFVAQTQTAGQSALETLNYKTETPTPTQSPTQTPRPAVVTATATANANCRLGPDAKFKLVEIIAQGTSSPVIGQNTNYPSWWQLELTDGQQCWVSADLLTISGNTAGIPNVDTLPLPTTFNSPWVGYWTAWQNQCLSNSSDCENTFGLTWDMTNATTIIGIYDTGGCTFIDVLTLSADQMRADGTETSPNCGGSWGVHLVMDPNLNQFRGRWNFIGNTSADGYYCGARNGAGKPNPTRP